MRKTLGIFAAGLVAVVASATPAHATAITWSGLTWETSSGGLTNTMSVVSGNLIQHATQTGTANNVSVGAGFGNNEASSNPLNTLNPLGLGGQWWVQASFIDRQNSDGTWPVMDMFYNGTGGTTRSYRGGINAGGLTDLGSQYRLEAGAQTSNQIGTGAFGESTWPRPGASAYNGLFGGMYFSPLGGDTAASISGGTKRSGLYAVTTGSAKAQGAGVPTANSLATAGFGSLVGRTAGTAVTIQIGKRADNVMEFKFIYGANTYIYTDAFYKNTAAAIDAANGNSLATTALTGMNLDQLEIREVGPLSGNDYTWTNFTYGSNYTTQIPEPASLGLMGLGSMLILARRRKMA